MSGRKSEVGEEVVHRPGTKADALKIIASVKENVKFRLHAAVVALPAVVGPHPTTFRACVPLSRAEVVQFIEDAFHPYHEAKGYAMLIRVVTGTRKARFVNGEAVEYGKPIRFVYIG